MGVRPSESVEGERAPQAIPGGPGPVNGVRAAVHDPGIGDGHPALGVDGHDGRAEPLRAQPRDAHRAVPGAALVVRRGVPTRGDRLPRHGGPQPTHVVGQAMLPGDRCPIGARLSTGWSSEQLREAALRLEVSADHHRVVSLERLGHPVHEWSGEAEGEPDLPDRRAGAVRDQVGDHPRVLDAVVLVHVLDDLLPTRRGEVDIDVRVGDGVLVDAPLVDEAVEQQVMADGVDTRDAQGVRHDRVARAASTLRGDAVLAGEAHEVLAHEEEPREVGPADDPQLVGQALLHRGADGGIAHVVALDDPSTTQTLELLVRGHAVRERHGREQVALGTQRHVEPSRQLGGQVQAGVPRVVGAGVDARHRVRAGRTCLELLPGDEVVLAVVTSQVGTSLHRQAVADGHQHVLEHSVIVRGVVGVRGDERGQADLVSELGHAGDEQVVVGGEVVLELREHSAPEARDVREVLHVPAQGMTRPLLVAPQDPSRDLAMSAAREQHQPVRVLLEQLVREPRDALGAGEVGGRDELAQASPAGHVTGQQDQVGAALPVPDPAQVLASRLPMAGLAQAFGLDARGQAVEGIDPLGWRVGGAPASATPTWHHDAVRVGDGAVEELDLHAQDGTHPGVLGCLREPDRTVQALVVGEGHRAQTERGATGDQVVDPGGTVEEREVGVDVEVRPRLAGHDGRRERRVAECRVAAGRRGECCVTAGRRSPRAPAGRGA